MSRIVVPGRDQATAFVGGVLGALEAAGQPATPVQRSVLGAVLSRFARTPLDVEGFTALPAEQVAAVLPEGRLRDELAHVVVVLELLAHPLPPEVEAAAERYLDDLGVRTPFVDIARDTAQEHLAALHADIIRNSWYTEETVRGALSGKLLELARSKLAYYAVGRDDTIARRWRALGDCPEGSWGRGVFEFYRCHDFPLPGEPHGIYEIGALHDWVHVLSDYATDPEGEIDVFAFIAGTMEDPKGFVQFIFTLALFQNASIDTVGGKHIPIARADTLSDPGAPERLADAFYRASCCTADVMGGVDHFALADEPLEGLRSRWSVPPKGVPGPGAYDVPAG